MSIQAPEPVAPAPAAAPSPAAVPAHEGPLGHVADWFRGHAEPGLHRAEADVKHAVTDVQGALEHAATALPVVVKVLNAAKLVDPADAELMTAFGELLPEALAMAGKAIGETLAALKAA